MEKRGKAWKSCTLTFLLLYVDKINWKHTRSRNFRRIPQNFFFFLWNSLEEIGTIFPYSSADFHAFFSTLFFPRFSAHFHTFPQNGKNSAEKRGNQWEKTFLYRNVWKSDLVEIWFELASFST